MSKPNNGQQLGVERLDNLHNNATGPRISVTHEFLESQKTAADNILKSNKLPEEDKKSLAVILKHLEKSTKELPMAAASGATTTFVSAPLAAGTTIALAPLFFLTWFLDVYNAVERRNSTTGVVSIVHDMRFEAIHNLFSGFISKTNEIGFDSASMPARKYIDDHFIRLFDEENAKYPGAEYPITRQLLAMVKTPNPNPEAPFEHESLGEKLQQSRIAG